jgi:hypothetical protein
MVNLIYKDDFILDERQACLELDYQLYYCPISQLLLEIAILPHFRETTFRKYFAKCKRNYTVNLVPLYVCIVGKQMHSVLSKETNHVKKGNNLTDTEKVHPNDNRI